MVEKITGKGDMPEPWPGFISGEGVLSRSWHRQGSSRTVLIRSLANNHVGMNRQMSAVDPADVARVQFTNLA